MNRAGRELSNYPARGHEAEGSSHETSGAKAAVAVQAQIRVSLTPSADAPITVRVNRLFAGENTFHTKRKIAAGKSMVPPQFTANSSQEGIVGTQAQIRHFNLRGIPVSPGPTGADYLDLAFNANGDKQCLQRWIIDGVYHKVELGREQLLCVGGHEESLRLVNRAIGINGSQAPGHHFDFRFPKLAIQSV